MNKDKQKDWHKLKDKIEAEEKLAADKAAKEHSADFEQEEEGAAPEAALTHPDYTALEEQLTLTEQKAQENWEKALRTAAELENYRRRSEADMAKERLYGKSNLLTDFIPVIDSLEQALQMTDKDEHKGTYEGLELTVKLFLDVLKKHNVQQIDPVGEPFNPLEHEAMTMQKSVDVLPDTVLTVFQKGYKLNDRVIRPARVIVTKAND